MDSLTQAALTVVSKYLRFGKTSSLLVTSFGALSFLLLITLRKKRRSQTWSEKKLSDNDMTRFLMSSEKVMKMIQDASFLSDIDVTLMIGDMTPDVTLTSDVTRGDVTLRCEDHEETGAGDGQVVTTHHQELWRLTTDISCHQMTSDISHHHDMTHHDVSVSGLLWHYTDKGQWDEAWSDYGSLESDQEDEDDDIRTMSDPLDWDVSRISLAEDGVL